MTDLHPVQVVILAIVFMPYAWMMVRIISTAYFKSKYEYHRTLMRSIDKHPWPSKEDPHG